MTACRAHRRLITPLPKRLGLAGLCLLLLSCATPSPGPVQESGAANTPTPADTSAPESSRAVSKPQTPAEPAAVTVPRKATIIDPLDAETGLQRHHEKLQQKADKLLPPEEVGYYLDNLHARLKQKLNNPGITLARDGDVVTIRVAGTAAFDANSVLLKSAMRENLVPLAEVMAEYDRTQIQILGHTDSSGPDEYNQKLSEQRAAALAVTLVEAGVAPARIAVVGFGEAQPLAPDTNSDARSQNRRLELRLQPVVANDS